LQLVGLALRVVRQRQLTVTISKAFRMFWNIQQLILIIYLNTFRVSYAINKVARFYFWFGKRIYLRVSIAAMISRFWRTLLLFVALVIYYTDFEWKDDCVRKNKNHFRQGLKSFFSLWVNKSNKNRRGEEKSNNSLILHISGSFLLNAT
jgi:hypothetical protein